MECLQAIKQAIHRETLNKWRFRLVICWVVVGTVLFGAFSYIEIKESSSHFRCNVTGDIKKTEKDSIRDKCYHQYLQNHQLRIPPYAFILIDVSLIPIVTLLYSYRVKPTLKRLERNHQDGEGEPTNQRRSRSLFIEYLFQLVVSVAVGITFIVLLQTYLLYPTNFPCPIKKLSVNRTQSTNSFSCSHDRAGYKNFWTKTATAANGVFAIFAFLEILWILQRARNGKIFMDNRQFYADHLKSNSDDQRQAQPETIPLVEPQHGAVNIPREPENDQRQAQPEAIPLVEPQHRAVNIPREPGNAEITISSEHPEHAQAQNDFPVPYRH